MRAWSQRPTVVVEAHVYQVYLDADIALTPEEHNAKAREFWGGEFALQQRHRMIAAGEWALALHTSTWEGYDDARKHAAFREYAGAQMEAYARGVGWFFWNFKVGVLFVTYVLGCTPPSGSTRARRYRRTRGGVAGSSGTSRGVF